MTKEARRTWVVFDGGFKFNGLLMEHERVTQALQGVSDSLLDRVLVLKSPAAHQCHHTQHCVKVVQVVQAVSWQPKRRCCIRGTTSSSAALTALLRTRLEDSPAWLNSWAYRSRGEGGGGVSGGIGGSCGSGGVCQDGVSVFCLFAFDFAFIVPLVVVVDLLLSSRVVVVVRIAVVVWG